MVLTCETLLTWTVRPLGPRRVERRAASSRVATRRATSRIRGDARENVGQPRLRINIVELGGLDERVHQRSIAPPMDLQKLLAEADDPTDRSVPSRFPLRANNGKNIKAELPCLGGIRAITPSTTPAMPSAVPSASTVIFAKSVVVLATQRNCPPASSTTQFCAIASLRSSCAS